MLNIKFKNRVPLCGTKVKMRTKSSSPAGIKMKEKGVSLYIAILIMSLFLAMGLGLSNILLNQIKIIREMGSSVVAFYAADTGIERVLMNKYNAASSNGVSENLDNGAGYLISVLLPGAGCDALNFCIKSVGTYKGTKRAIEATY